MTEEELILNIKNMMELPAETEYIEFKEAKEDFDFEKLGKYFSAISNETKLKKQKYGYVSAKIIMSHGCLVKFKQ